MYGPIAQAASEYKTHCSHRLSHRPGLFSLPLDGDGNSSADVFMPTHRRSVRACHPSKKMLLASGGGAIDNGARIVGVELRFGILQLEQSLCGPSSRSLF